jgi:hypothetical protein
VLESSKFLASNYCFLEKVWINFWIKLHTIQSKQSKQSESTIPNQSKHTHRINSSEKNSIIFWKE